MHAVKIIRSIAIFLVFALITSCASTRSIADGVRVKPSLGLVAFKVTTNLDHAQLQYKKFLAQETRESMTREYFLGPDESVVLKAGEKYWLMPVEPGAYMWSRIFEYSREARFHSSNRFTVEAGKITYVGHIEVMADDDMAKISVRDDEADMTRYIQANYPIYYSSMKMEKSVTEFR